MCMTRAVADIILGHTFNDPLTLNQASLHCCLLICTDKKIYTPLQTWYCLIFTMLAVLLNQGFAGSYPYPVTMLYRIIALVWWSLLWPSFVASAALPCPVLLYPRTGPLLLWVVHFGMTLLLHSGV